MNVFRQLSVRKNLFSLLGVAALGLVAVSLVAMSLSRQGLHADRQGKVKQFVDLPFGILAHFHALETDGVLAHDPVRWAIFPKKVAAALTAIEELRRQSNDVSLIVRVIKEIADQTNLLALNAAIKTARAGDVGRGFAEVTDEVRTLAERTSSSTAQISSVVSSIQKVALDVEHGMAAISASMSNGVERSHQAEASIPRTKDSSGQITAVVNNVGNALVEQRSANTEIAQAIEKIAQMSEHNVEVAGEAEKQSRHPGILAERLRSNVGMFRF
jgi:methyl-accepting chemotaxis protein